MGPIQWKYAHIWTLSKGEGGIQPESKLHLLSAWIWILSKHFWVTLLPKFGHYEHFFSPLFSGLKKVPCRCPRKQGGGGQGNFYNVQIWGFFFARLLPLATHPRPSTCTMHRLLVWLTNKNLPKRGVFWLKCNFRNKLFGQKSLVHAVLGPGQRHKQTTTTTNRHCDSKIKMA